MDDVIPFQHDPILFILCALGKRIKILKVGWENTVLKHPELNNLFPILITTLEHPEVVTNSKLSPEVHLYFAPYRNHYFCVVCKHYNGDGFLITAYITHRIKGTNIL